MSSSTLLSRGRITIPKEVRNFLGLQSGDRIDFTVSEDGRVILTRSTIDIAELDGLLAAPGTKAASVEDMTSAVEREVVRSTSPIL